MSIVRFYWFGSVLMLVSFAACGSQGEKTNPDAKPIDAASVAMTIVAPQYTISNLQYSEPSWVEKDLSLVNNTVYYICHDEERSIVCSLDCVTLQRSEIYFSVSDTFLDISASQNHIYILACDKESEHNRIIELSINGNEQRSLDFDAATFAEKSIHDIVFADDLLFALGSDKLVGYKVGDRLDEVYSREVSPQAVISKTADGSLVLGVNENGVFTLMSYKAKNHTWGKNAAFNMIFNTISCGSTWDYYLGDSSALYGYSTATDTLEKLLSWNSLGINSGNVAELEDGTLVSSARINPDEKSPLIFLKNERRHPLKCQQLSWLLRVNTWIIG